MSKIAALLMKIFDLSFTDGRTCRVIDPDPEGNAEESLRGYQSMFQPGYLVGLVQVVAPPPAKLPWKPVKKGLWRCKLFVLKKLDDGSLYCFWPGGEVTGGKDEISAAVRENWHLGC